MVQEIATVALLGKRHVMWKSFYNVLLTDAAESAVGNKRKTCRRVAEYIMVSKSRKVRADDHN